MPTGRRESWRGLAFLSRLTDTGRIRSSPGHDHEGGDIGQEAPIPSRLIAFIVEVDHGLTRPPLGHRRHGGRSRAHFGPQIASHGSLRGGLFARERSLREREVNPPGRAEGPVVHRTADGVG
jgi:hypothetical protein